MKGHIVKADAKSSLIQCPNCGSNRVETHWQADPFIYGAGTAAVELSAVIPFRECVDCNFGFTDSEAEDARHESICRYLGVMTPKEVVALRQKYTTARSEFAAKTRLGEASLARWETGLLIQNAANDDYLYLLGFPENMRRLEMRRSADPLHDNEPVASPTVAKFRQLTDRPSKPEERAFLRAKGASSCT
jgi:DNA-binding transcriptional regulator YiaG